MENYTPEEIEGGFAPGPLPDRCVCGGRLHINIARVYGDEGYCDGCYWNILWDHHTGQWFRDHFGGRAEPIPLICQE